jgi:hypothetical protein
MEYFGPDPYGVGQTPIVDQPSVCSLPIRQGESKLDKTSCDILSAADSWLSVLQAMTAADEAQRGTLDQQLCLDDAEMALAAATMTWREAGRPNLIFGAVST